MNENLLSFLWENKLLNTLIKTVDNKEIVVLSAGQRNYNQGPDYVNAKVRIGENLWCGNVELHINASDWFLHCHHVDANYANVICHFVWNYDADVYYMHRERIPTIEVSKYIPEFLLDYYSKVSKAKTYIPCAKLIKRAPRYLMYEMIEDAYYESLDAKVNALNENYKNFNNDLDQLCYYTIIRNFGFNVNSYSFGVLAKSLPFKYIRKYKNNDYAIEALMFGQANMIPKEPKDKYTKIIASEYEFYRKLLSLQPSIALKWNMLRLRPPNFPCVRIAQAIAFLKTTFNGIDSLLKDIDINFYRKLLRQNVENYWDKHLMFDKETNCSKRTIGNSSIDLIIINSILPIIYFYGKQRDIPQICEQAIDMIKIINAEDNVLIRNWKKLGVKPKNAMHSQGLIYMKKNYCNKKRCPQCKIFKYL